MTLSYNSNTTIEGKSWSINAEPLEPIDYIDQPLSSKDLLQKASVVNNHSGVKPTQSPIPARKFSTWLLVKKPTDPSCNVVPAIFLAHKPMDRTVVFCLHFDSRPLTKFCNQIIKSPKNAAFLLLPERLTLITGLFHWENPLFNSIFRQLVRKRCQTGAGQLWST